MPGPLPHRGSSRATSASASTCRRGRRDRHARYPVLYVHDGQNVFDGVARVVLGHSWALDVTLDRLIRAGLGGAADRRRDRPRAARRRLDEFTPTRAPSAAPGGGAAARYARFLVEELKPFVDRPLPDRTVDVVDRDGGIVDGRAGHARGRPAVSGDLRRRSAWSRRRSGGTTASCCGRCAHASCGRGRGSGSMSDCWNRRARSTTRARCGRSWCARAGTSPGVSGTTKTPRAITARSRGRGARGRCCAYLLPPR